VGQDGWGYKVIWDFGKSEYFCKEGWTRGAINCPDDLPVRQRSLGWVERFAKSIAVVLNINVIAGLDPAIHLFTKRGSSGARTHKSSLIGVGLTNVRYAPVATRFLTAAK
jgi:hypothetical protein